MADEPVFVCAQCGAPTELAAADPTETVCTECCPDHDYENNSCAGWPTCVHCNKFAPDDWYEESGWDV